MAAETIGEAIEARSRVGLRHAIGRRQHPVKWHANGNMYKAKLVKQKATTRANSHLWALLVHMHISQQGNAPRGPVANVNPVGQAVARKTNTT